MSPRPESAVRWFLRAGLSGVLIWAALPKLLDPSTFLSDVQNYRLLPPDWVPLFAVLLPATELVVALSLLLPRVQRGAALLATLLFASFAVAMTQARLRGIDLRCGCFGAAYVAEVSWFTVARALGLGAAAGYVLSERERESRAEAPPNQ